MNDLRHLRCLALFAMMAGLSACSRDRTGDVAVLEEEVCRLTEVTASSRAQLSLLRAEANRLDAAVFDLTSTKADLEDEVYSIQTTIREVRQDWATLAKSGVEKDSFVVGARLSSLGVGYKVYRDVIVKQVTAHDVLISHADGIARLKKHELLDMDEPPLELKPLNLATYVPPTPASMALKVTPPQYAARGRESQAAPSRSSRVVPMPFNNRSSQKQKPRPKTVEILSWWGRGSPYRRPAHGLVWNGIRSHATEAQSIDPELCGTLAGVLWSQFDGAKLAKRSFRNGIVWIQANRLELPGHVLGPNLRLTPLGDAIYDLRMKLKMVG